jgi:polar amino acid transport system permease protein
VSKLLSDVFYIGSGAALTMELLVGGILLGLALGVVFAILRRYRWARPVICGLVSVIRGTPVLLQISIFYFILIPALFRCDLGIRATGIIALGINSAAYVSEILRGGIESLPKGQFEAAYALGIPPFYMWRDIILPQVIMNVLPSLVNETVSLLKETALIATIGGMDITRRAQAIAAARYEYFTPLCIAAVTYYALVRILEFIGKKIENRKLYAENM